MSQLSARNSTTPREKYAHLVAYCTARIRSGEWKEKDRLPTFVVLQEQFGVTPGTVNRAMIALEHQGLVERKRGSGTFVAAPQIVPVRKGIIGLCGAGITYQIEPSPYWARLVYGIRGAAQKRGQHVLLLDHRTTEGWEKADGMLISDYSSRFLTNMIPHGLPCVSLLTANEEMSSVYSDDAAGICQSIEHLVGLGHRKISYFHGGNGELTERVKSYRSALEAADIRVRKSWMRTISPLSKLDNRFDYGYQFVETGRENMRTWLRDGWSKLGCTAILAHNDEFAIGIIEALQQAGIRVPEEVSVIGFDGSETAIRSQPSLSTVEVPLEEIGRKGVEMLLQQIEADAISHDDCILPVTLRLRASTTSPTRKPRDSAEPDAKGA